MSCFGEKPQRWPQMATFFDRKSLPADVPWGRWRHLTNMMSPGPGQLCRASGWKKFGRGLGHSNSDLHDQMLAKVEQWEDFDDLPGLNNNTYPPPAGLCGAEIAMTTVAEPITSLHVHPDKTKRLFAGTQSRIYSQRGDGGWMIKADGQGGTGSDPGVRWSFASNARVVLATNNVVEPLFHLLDEPPSGCGAQAFHPSESLRAVGLTRAKVAASWRGVFFLMDVVMDGAHVPFRVYYGNANAPFEFEVATGSSAGFMDLAPDDVCMGGLPMAGGFYIFTTRSVWRVSIASGGHFAWDQVYYHKEGEGCITAQHSLALIRDEAMYYSSGSICTFSGYTPYPQTPEWIDRGTAIINSEADCRLITGAYRAKQNDEAYVLFWPSPGATLADKGFFVSIARQMTSELDDGATAALSVPSRAEMEYAQWLVAKRICTAASVDQMFPAYKEDDRVYPDPQSIPVERVYSYANLTLEEGIVMEDWSKPPVVPAGMTTLCSRLSEADYRCNECDVEPVFVTADPVDFALKEWDPEYFGRDRWTGPYQITKRGYGLRILTGAIHFNREDLWKRLSHVYLLFEITNDTPLRQMTLRIGSSGTPADPMDPKCRIQWFTCAPKDMKCSTATGAPNDRMNWPIVMEGRYLYLDFTMPAVTEAGVCFASLLAEIIESPNTSG